MSAEVQCMEEDEGPLQALAPNRYLSAEEVICQSFRSCALLVFLPVQRSLVRKYLTCLRPSAPVSLAVLKLALFLLLLLRSPALIAMHQQLPSMYHPPLTCFFNRNPSPPSTHPELHLQLRAVATGTPGDLDLTELKTSQPQLFEQLSPGEFEKETNDLLTVLPPAYQSFLDLCHPSSGTEKGIDKGSLNLQSNEKRQQAGLCLRS